MHHPAVSDLSHAEREAAVYNAYVAAVQREDELEAIRLWAEFVELHKQRPVS